MKKNFLFWITFVFAVLIAIYLSARIVMVSMGMGNAGHIKNISISTNNGKMDKSTIASAINISPNTPSYRVKLDDVLNNILAIPDVETASVRRLANGNLSVRVNLRTVIAYWTDGENYFPIADDAHIINRPLDIRPNNTIVFKGSVPNALQPITDAMKKVPKIMADSDYVEWVANRRWNIIMKNGIVIMLPELGIDAAVVALYNIDKKTNILARNVKAVDLRDPARTFLKMN